MVFGLRRDAAMQPSLGRDRDRDTPLLFLFTFYFFITLFLVEFPVGTMAQAAGYNDTPACV
jgi:hypothetical protein